MAIRYKGKSYPTRKALCEELGLNYDVVNMRMARGLTLKQAVEFKRKKSFRFRGKLYNTYQELIDDLNLPLTVNQLKHRIRIDGSLAKAVKHEPVSYEVNYKGKTYGSLRELAEAVGINYSTLKSRLSRGYGLKEAVRIEQSASAQPRRKNRKKAKTRAPNRKQSPRDRPQAVQRA